MQCRYKQNQYASHVGHYLSAPTCLGLVSFCRLSSSRTPLTYIIARTSTPWQATYLAGHLGGKNHYCTLTTAWKKILSATIPPFRNSAPKDNPRGLTSLPLHVLASFRQPTPFRPGSFVCQECYLKEKSWKYVYHFKSDRRLAADGTEERELANLHPSESFSGHIFRVQWRADLQSRTNTGSRSSQPSSLAQPGAEKRSRSKASMGSSSAFPSCDLTETREFPKSMLARRRRFLVLRLL